MSKNKKPAQGRGSALHGCSDSWKRQNIRAIDTRKSIANNYYIVPFEIFRKTPAGLQCFHGNDLVAERASLAWALVRWVGSAMGVDGVTLKREIDRGLSLLEGGEIVGMRISADPVSVAVSCCSGPVCVDDELVLTVAPVTGTLIHSRGRFDGNAYPPGGSRLRFRGG